MAALMVAAATPGDRLTEAEEILSINRRAFGARNHHAGAKAEHLLILVGKRRRAEVTALMVAAAATGNGLTETEEILIAVGIGIRAEATALRDAAAAPDNRLTEAEHFLIFVGKRRRAEVAALMVTAAAASDRLAESVEGNGGIDGKRPLNLLGGRVERRIDGDGRHRGAKTNQSNVRPFVNHHGMCSLRYSSAFTQ